MTVNEISQPRSFFRKEEGMKMWDILDVLSLKLWDEFKCHHFDAGHQTIESNIPTRCDIEFKDNQLGKIHRVIFTTYAFRANRLDELVEGTRLFINDYWSNIQKDEVILTRKPITFSNINDWRPEEGYKMMCRLGKISSAIYSNCKLVLDK